MNTRLVVVAICSAAIIVDGYDLIVYGKAGIGRLPSSPSVMA